jgi:hypothetical protein
MNANERKWDAVAGPSRALDAPGSSLAAARLVPVRASICVNLRSFAANRLIRRVPGSFARKTIRPRVISDRPRPSSDYCYGKFGTYSRNLPEDRREHAADAATPLYASAIGGLIRICWNRCFIIASSVVTGGIGPALGEEAHPFQGVPWRSIAHISGGDNVVFGVGCGGVGCWGAWLLPVCPSESGRTTGASRRRAAGTMPAGEARAVGSEARSDPTDRG